MSDMSTGEWAPLLCSRPISLLLASECDHDPPALTVDPADRHVAVDWILKVNDFYNFRPVTAFLSVCYLDRFLSSRSLPEGGGWAMQLAAVACVSVAAKMEETHVPLLLDLQVLAPGFVFEPTTIRRMELLLMSALQWKLRPVTPFDFLDCFANGGSAPELLGAARVALLSRAANTIVRTCRIVDFLEYRPSVIAAAAFVHSAGAIAESSSDRFLKCLNNSISEETVKSCIELMEEHLTDTPTLQSPIGVLDDAACRSCDDSNKSSELENLSDPVVKRRRLGDED